MTAFASIGQALLGLLAVLAVIGALAWVARRMQLPGQGRGALLRQVGGLAVGARERVVVVELGDTWLVLGVTAQSVNALHTLPRGEMPEASSPAAMVPGSFAALLARARKSK